MWQWRYVVGRGHGSYFAVTGCGVALFTLAWQLQIVLLRFWHGPWQYHLEVLRL